MHAKYPGVFSPIRLGPVELPNRFFFAPHGSALSAGTKPADDLVAYSAERVKGGGCGLVIVALAMHERGRTRQPVPHEAVNIPAFRVLTDAIHEAGGKIFGEPFYHWIGAGFWQPLSPPAPALAPSVRQFGHGGRAHSTRAMSRDEIARMIEATRETAANMAEAGFDGIMLHVSHAALIQQFLSPWFNERTDEYGGSLENRMRFLVESLQAARQGGGDNFAVGLRLNCDEQLDGGYGPETAREVVTRLVDQGLIDYIDLDVGLEPQQFRHGMPTGFEKAQYYRPWVEVVRSAAGGVPVFSVLGNLTSMADAEAALQAGVCDVIGAARQLIAEPDFVQNAREGREERGRTCIACNWCTAAGGEGAQGCAINPASYRDRLWGRHSYESARESRRVVVIGGGPGGMEAARVAAAKGHKVTLFEAREALGGALSLWAGLPGRGHYRAAIDWWAAELDRLGVDVRLSSAADEAVVLAEVPDAVIVATGATYSPGGRSITHDGDIPGSDQPHVLTPEEVLLGGVRPSGNVWIFDAEGYHTGTGIAEMLAEGGAGVRFVTAGYSPVSARNTDNWEEYYIVGRMKRAGVELVPTTWLREIGPDTVMLRDVHTGEARVEPADAVVLATGRVPQDALARALEGKVAQLFTVGDALAARMLAAATFEGQKFARAIGEPDAPASFADAWFSPDPLAVMPFPADVPRPAPAG
ncbi:FAD-dependent oxidoreductase [Novosphingobium mangrovi (ex Huang et al. 2023)]|uniref:FAD-dependent oxidoreductase n=1 Tax=Novosphingobium mangrovi (ex Huang et al. 2023) TaxID=2976432 RepID=A0ABT2I822_9SPHN|nr:FAD-dependent oxidoreductase [Novosphingobium mangrovi (ex Huang et al. 2023)]MCT2400692.1 FAD-dependent oxidoreductase [Novosphingobium mangrovi (ex Huang et al. 2023)]